MWLGYGQTVAAYQYDGTPLTQFAVAGPALKGLVYDPQLDQVWVALSNAVRRYDTAGLPVLETRVNGLSHITLAATPGVWLASANRVYRVDATGHITLQLDAFPGKSNGATRDLLADPRQDSVWVVNAKSAKHIAATGAVYQNIAAVGNAQFNAASLYIDDVPPQLTITAPQAGETVTGDRPTIHFTFSDAGSGVNAATLAVEFNHAPVALACALTSSTAVCTPSAAQTAGDITVTGTLKDNAGNVSVPAQVNFTLGDPGPRIEITSPLLTNAAAYTLTGRLSESGTLTVNGNAVAVDPLNANAFTSPATLTEGTNAFVLIATNGAGGITRRTFNIILDTTAPAAIVLEQVRVRPAANNGGQVTVTGLAGSVEPGARVTITNSRTGATITVTANADGSFSADIAALGGDELSITVADAAGNHSSKVTVGVGLTDLAAPPLPLQIPTTVADAVSFLYTGANPVQTGVNLAAMTPRRLSLIHGNVQTRDGSPLADVLVTVLARPEFGQTRSRSSGEFDLAVNGGGPVVFQFSQPGFLPVQRTVEVPWQDMFALPAVIMVPIDPAVTVVNFQDATTPMKIARGSVVTDGDGIRQLTVMIPQGVSAQMTLPNGTTRALTTGAFRATEYTVGVNGPASMPADLPATSGYTYAVELSFDESLAAGATQVTFSAPLPVYVDNFLNFPVGVVVPSGFYDRGKAAWLHADNGRVVKILSVNAGMADLDISGSNTAATSAQLTALGVSDSERTQLASLYSVGKSLWRMPTRHFTSYDYNEPMGPSGPPASARLPDGGNPIPPVPEDEPACESGSIIECQNQTLGERLAVTGTPFTLNYRSDRALDYTAAFSVDIPLVGAAVPPEAKSVEVHIVAAGMPRLIQRFPVQANSSYRFIWNGRDPFGRRLSSTTATISVANVYDGVYYTSRDDFQNAWANTAANAAITVPARGEVLVNRQHRVKIGRGTHGFLGGWTLDAHHTYDVQSRVLRYGDGRQRNTGSSASAANTGNNEVTRFAGTGVHGFGPYSVPATESQLDIPWHLTVGPDGSVFVADYWAQRVVKIDPQGMVTVVAGTGVPGYNGDNRLATTAHLYHPRSVAAAPRRLLHRRRRQSPHPLRQCPRNHQHRRRYRTARIWRGRRTGHGGPITLALRCRTRARWHGVRSRHRQSPCAQNQPRRFDHHRRRQRRARVRRRRRPGDSSEFEFTVGHGSGLRRFDLHRRYF